MIQANENLGMFEWILFDRLLEVLYIPAHTKHHQTLNPKPMGVDWDAMNEEYRYHSFACIMSSSLQKLSRDLISLGHTQPPPYFFRSHPDTTLFLHYTSLSLYLIIPNINYKSLKKLSRDNFSPVMLLVIGILSLMIDLLVALIGVADLPIELWHF